MSFRVCSGQCDSCIYRKKDARTGERLHWDTDRLEAQIKDEAGYFQGFRICHAFSIEDGDQETGEQVCCRGFWNRHKDDFPGGQLAQRFGMVREIEIPK